MSKGCDSLLACKVSLKTCLKKKRKIKTYPKKIGGGYMFI